MHILLGAICAMFGVLWLRAMARVRVHIGERASLSRHVTSVLKGLSPSARFWTVCQVVTLQAAVRRRLATILAQRMLAMKAYVFPCSLTVHKDQDVVA